MPSARLAMASALPCEISRFRKGCKQLRRVLKETQQVHGDIRREGWLNQDQLSKMKLTPEDESTIWGVIEQPVGMVVLGRSCWAKACVVNELLGQSLLPVVPYSKDEESNRWRLVRFCYGKEPLAKFVLPNGFELLDRLQCNDDKVRNIPLADLELEPGKEGEEDSFLQMPALEVSLLYPLLHDNVNIVLTPSGHNMNFIQLYKRCTEGITPIIFYAIGNTLTDKDIEDLMDLRQVAPNTPVFFVCVCHPSMSELTESGQHEGKQSPIASSRHSSSCSHRHPLEQLSLIRHYSSVRGSEDPPSQLLQRLGDLGFFPSSNVKPEYKGPLHVSSELVNSSSYYPSIVLFVSHVLQAHLLLSASLLHETHTRCLQNFILTAFDLSRDILITPKRLEYARQREDELFRSLWDIASNKQEDIRNMIATTIAGASRKFLELAENHLFKGISLPLCTEFPSSRVVNICTSELQDEILSQVNSVVASKVAGSIEWLQERFTGTLERCLTSLEESCRSDGEAALASGALKQILTAAYQVDVTLRSSSSIFSFLMEKMKQLVQVLPWKVPPRIDAEWKRQVAADILSRLNEARLARSVCSQLQQRLRTSHERFVASLQQLEERHVDRLERRETERKHVRCLYAPRVARLALESSSLKDMLQHGMPQLGQELGRGHFGVVYSCKTWAGHSPCAVKTVILPADKHWYSLAMEFYYHRNIPENDRIVQLRGTVIDCRHDRRPTVFLIMDRMERDLYSALWNGLAWIPRLQVALDVIEGIRFLHSQGLVHRDIKLHNVLMDKSNRAKLSDLGFCKVEVMMSGSVVGTPIHMAPEMFQGHYDNSVDIYAFGVLFWYVCSGQPRMPYVYEQCPHKEDLFSMIKKGLRPERLPYFDEECWKLMTECWHANPTRRPLPGVLEARVQAVLDRFRTRRVVEISQSEGELSRSNDPSDYWTSTSYDESKSYLVVTDEYVSR